MFSTEGSFDHLVQQIYEAPLAPGGWTSVIPALEQQLGGGVAIFAQNRGGVSLVAKCSGCTYDQMRAYEDRFWREDRAMAELRTSPVGHVVLDRSIVSRSERLKSAFYNDYLGALGTDRGIYASFYQDRTDTLIVSAQRPASIGDYDVSEIDLVRALSPHLSRSFRTWERLRKAQHERRAAMQALDYVRHGLVLVDSDSRVVSASEVAERQFRSGSLALEKGRLAAARQFDTMRLRRAVANAARPEVAVPATIELPAHGTRGPLSIVVAPASSLDNEPGTPALVALFVSSNETLALDEDAVRRTYDLTAAESRLLSALVAGERLPDYARRRGISVTTAKSHLSALFDKTGERRQADLIRRVLSRNELRLPSLN